MGEATLVSHWAITALEVETNFSFVLVLGLSQLRETMRVLALVLFKALV